MKREILERIAELGGDIRNVKGESLAEDLMSIKFNTVLYPRPTDTAWSKAEDTEPIYGLMDFIDENYELLENDRPALYEHIIETFYRLTNDPHGQMFWTAQLFTPFREGTADYDEWHEDFENGEITDLSEITKFTNDPRPDFIEILYSYGFPDNYYIALSDPDPDNPTLFGTDHEVFFSEVSNEGRLEAFLKRMMTADELIEILRRRIDR